MKNTLELSKATTWGSTCWIRSLTAWESAAPSGRSRPDGGPEFYPHMLLRRTRITTLCKVALDSLVWKVKE